MDVVEQQIHLFVEECDNLQVIINLSINNPNYLNSIVKLYVC